MSDGGQLDLLSGKLQPTEGSLERPRGVEAGLLALRNQESEAGPRGPRAPNSGK